MSENNLLKDVNRAIDEEVSRGITDITEKFKKDGKAIFTKIETFFESVDENFNIDKLKVYVERPFLFRNGPLRNMLAGNGLYNIKCG